MRKTWGNIYLYIKVIIREVDDETKNKQINKYKFLHRLPLCSISLIEGGKSLFQNINMINFFGGSPLVYYYFYESISYVEVMDETHMF